MVSCRVSQTYTGDYNGAGYPFHCQPISNRSDAVRLDIDGSLSTDDPELEVMPVPSFAWQPNSCLPPGSLTEGISLLTVDPVFHGVVCIFHCA